MANVRKATGREPGRFKPYDIQPRIVSRMGIYKFTSSSTTTTAFNIADAGGNSSGSGLQTGATSGYDDCNILIHWIKVINDGTGFTNLDQTKQLHFWCKNDTTVPANELFSITVPPANKDTDGGLDVTIDFPIPLLIEGGAIIRPSSSGSNRQLVVTICYTVLNSKSVGRNSSIRYKFLSATTVDEASKTAYLPGTTDTYNEDIQLWGVSMINLYNTFGGAHLAKTHVINADNVTIAEVAIHKEDSKSIPIPWLDKTHKCDEHNDPSGTPYHGTKEICEAADDHTLDPQDEHWGWNLVITDWERITAYPGARNKGSDTYTTFFRFPIYCKGNTTAPNFRMGVDYADRTRATWFYRPVKAVGLDHGWV